MSRLEKVKKYRLSKSWWLILILIFLITTALLALIKKGNVPVRIELTVSNSSFILVDTQEKPLFSALPVKSARFVHFEKFIIPFSMAEIATKFDEDNLVPSGWKRVNAHDTLIILPNDSFSSVIFANVRLNELNLSQGTQVTLTAPSNQTIQVTAVGLMAGGKLDFGDTLALECQYCTIDSLADRSRNASQHLRIFTAKAHKIISFRSEKDRILISMNLQPEIKFSAEHTLVRKLSFIKSNSKFPYSSVVKPGKIVFEDLDNKEIRIEPHDFVEIDTSSVLRIAEMKFQNDGIELVVIGKVNELKTGSVRPLANRLYTLIVWLQYQQPLILWLGVVTAIIMFIAQVLLPILDFLRTAHKGKGKLTP